MMLGLILTKLMPATTQKIKDSFALQYWGKGVGKSKIGKRIETLIRFYLAHSNKNKGDILEKSHKDFWRNEIDAEWYQKSEARFHDATLPPLAPHIAALNRLIKDTKTRTLCEIGTGDGMLLSHLKNTLASHLTFIGLDLSEQRMALNRNQFSDINFLACDAFDWISQRSEDHTVYITNGGVMEYFSQASLEALFKQIRTEQPHSIISLFHEPIAPDHDLNHDVESRLTLGGEFSYSHNYPKLLERAGFTIQHLEEESHPAGYRALTIIATV
ncbi:class I SAM-dependent methyltransferase [Simiduia curdlanivorans]|nr:class I SAM-dependent methyltransferase [Simiduia curdlanivorans]